MTIPHVGRRLRIIGLLYGFGLFLWMSVEDNAVWPVTLFGFGLSALMAALTFLDKLGGKKLPVRVLLPVVITSGALVGLGTAIATAVLMFFKNALHAHMFWDYPPGLILAIVRRAFAWASAGALVGLGLTLGWLALSSYEQNTEEVAKDAP
jgi:hypothetical protein